MAYNTNHKLRIKDLKTAGTRMLNEISNSGSNMTFPPSDGNIYVIKNGAWVKASSVSVSWETLKNELQ